MKLVRRLLALALFAGAFYAAIRFSRDNADEVSIDLLGLAQPSLELWLALLAAFALGAVGAALVLFFEVAKLGLVARRYRRTVRRLESEIHQLRNLPLAGTEAAEPPEDPVEGLATGENAPARTG